MTEEKKKRSISGFQNYNGTLALNKLESKQKTLHVKNISNSKNLPKFRPPTAPLQVIHEDPKENQTEIKGEICSFDNKGLQDKEKEINYIKESSKIEVEEDKKEDEEHKDAEEEKKEKAEENKKYVLYYKPWGVAKIKFDSLLLWGTKEYYQDFINPSNLINRGPNFDDVDRIPDWLADVQKFLTMHEYVPSDSKFAKCLHEARKICGNMKFDDRGETSQNSSRSMSQVARKKFEAEAHKQRIKDLLMQYLQIFNIFKASCINDAHKILEIPTEAGKKKKETKEQINERLKLESVAKIESERKFFKILRIYLKHYDEIGKGPTNDYEKDNEKSKSKIKIGIFRYLTFAFSRKEFCDSFIKNFYQQFDTNHSDKIEIGEFKKCVNFIAQKMNDKELMTELFKCMGVRMDGPAMKLIQAGSVTGSVFDVSVYEKAFKRMREFKDQDPEKDWVTFQNFYPYLYLFYIVYETECILSRKKLYKSFNSWILSAFRSLRNNRKNVVGEVEQPLTKKKSTVEGNEQNTETENEYTYSEIVEALTKLQAQRHEYFGSNEFHIITEFLQEKLDVDPITFNSISKLKLIVPTENAKPLLLWENDTKDECYSLERLLSLRLSELAMCKSLSEVNKNCGDDEYTREDKLIYYNEYHYLEKTGQLAEYLGQIATKNPEIERNVGEYISLLTNWISKVFPGFDKLDAALIIHHYYMNECGKPIVNDSPDKQEKKIKKYEERKGFFHKINIADPKDRKLPRTISIYDQKHIAKQLMPLIDRITYERCYDIFLRIGMGLNMQSLSSFYNANNSDIVKSSNSTTEEPSQITEKKQDISITSLNKNESTILHPRNHQNQNSAEYKKGKVAASQHVKEKKQEKKKSKENREKVFEEEPTVFEGLDLRGRQKKKEQPRKIVDMSGIYFEKRIIVDNDDDKDDKKSKCIIM